MQETIIQESKDALLSEGSLGLLDTFAHQEYNVGNYQGALPIFRLLTTLRPEARYTWMGLGATSQMLKRYEEAIAAYSYAAVLDASDPYVHFHAAECYYAVADSKKAFAALEAALSAAHEATKHRRLFKQLRLLHARWCEQNSGGQK